MVGMLGELMKPKIYKNIILYTVSFGIISVKWSENIMQPIFVKIYQNMVTNIIFCQKYDLCRSRRDNF